jgi:hypothetical protein
MQPADALFGKDLLAAHGVLLVAASRTPTRARRLAANVSKLRGPQQACLLTVEPLVGWAASIARRMASLMTWGASRVSMCPA